VGRLACLLSLILCAIPSLASQRVTVAEVRQFLSGQIGEKDGAIAKKLAGLELSERVSSAELAQWQQENSGPRTRQALIVLADSSQFLDLPADEVTTADQPDADTQRKIMALAVEYVAKTLPRLPNFFATRETTRFVNLPQEEHASDAEWKRERPMRFLDQVKATVLVRDGKEVVDPGKVKNQNQGLFNKGIVTEGVFGPILGIVMVDSARGTLSWAHWEKAPSGRIAVFRYSVPQDKSHYTVRWCCTTLKQEGNRFYLKPFQKYVAYHGEFGIDPDSGVILRIAIVADLEPSDPILKSSIAVEYGPVEIGGRTYSCPIKSVAYSLQTVVLFGWGHPVGDTSERPKEVSLNDVVFGDYHQFRSESRILTAAEAAGIQPEAGSEPAPPPATAKPQD